MYSLDVQYVQSSRMSTGHCLHHLHSCIQIYNIQGKLSTKILVRFERKLFWGSANLWKPSTKAENESRVQKLQEKLEHQDESGKSVG